MISKNIFRAYDIRGVYGKDLTDDVAKKVGMAFGTFTGKGAIGVGMDVRISGTALKKKLIEGLASVGCDVIDFGIVSTPMLSIMVKNKKLAGGVMITASHNPKEWNGFIMINSSGHFCSEGFGMEKIKGIIFDNSFAKSDKLGTVKEENPLQDYEKFVLPKIKLNKKLKVVVDAGNGSASCIASGMFRKLGCEVIAINDYHDGNFPSHIPDVTENALTALKEKVKESGADFGIAFDCDADRAAFIDEKGRYIGSGNTTIAIFSDYYLARSKGAKIVFDVCCSSSIEDFIRSKGGIPVINRVGHAFIVNRMIEEKAIFGGEYSNHLYFSDIYGFDDAIFAGLKMAEIVSEKGRLSGVADAVPRYHTSDVKEIHCPDEKKFEVIEKIREELKKSYKTVDLDGVKCFSEDGSFLIRASNTAPSIKLNAEARTEGSMRRLFDFGAQLIQKNLGGMKAVIVAAGVGTRLQQVIGNNQKVMLEYSGRPLLQRTIEMLKERGINEIIVVVGYQKEKIMDYFGDGRRFGVHIEYVFQKHPKGGTADATGYAKEKINDKFLLIYGDNIFDANTLDSLLAMSNDFDGVMCGKRVDNPSNYGILEIKDGRVMRIYEKPEIPVSNIANTGIFILPKEIFSAIEKTGLSPRGEYELTDSIQILIDKGLNIGCLVSSDFWSDPRNKEEIDQANAMMKNGNV